MVDHIINATPMVVDLGREDNSTKVVTPEPLPRPTHCPKFWLFTKKGGTDSMLVDGNKAAEIYGTESFKSTSKYYNHATVYATGIMAEGNAITMERITPDNAAKGSMILWLEMANADIPVYNRDAATGKEIYGEDGNPVPVIDPVDGVSDLTIDGYKLRWSLTAHSTSGSNPAVELDFGGLSPKVGTLTHKDGSTATAYPIMELSAESKGAFSDLTGLRIFPAKKDEIPNTIIDSAKVLPFFVQVIRKKDETTSPSVVSSKFGEKQVMFSYKKNAVDPGTTRELDISSKFFDYYANTTDTTLPLIASDFGDIHVYHENIDTILTALFAKEVAYLESPTSGVTTNYSWYDFSDNDVSNMHLFNIHSAQSSGGVPYFTAQMDTSSGGLSMTKVSNHMMSNGSDGTMTDEVYETLVRQRIAEYADDNSPVMDNAINVESFVHDSGFTLETKLDLAKFISKRNDTFASFTTYISGNKAHTASEDHAIGVALMATLNLYPDSSYYGTSVFRAIIVGQSELLKNHVYKERVGLNYEIAKMTARSCGAGNRIWDLGQGLGRYPGNLLTEGKDIQPAFIPPSAKYNLWDTGIVWAQPYNAVSNIFPGIQTVYSNSTSVLNNYIVAMAVIELDKISWDAWRTFTNTSCSTDEQLAELVTTYVNGRINDIDSFDSCIKVNVLTFYTSDDTDRGYSWHLTFQVGGPNLKTVETVSIETYHINELP